MKTHIFFYIVVIVAVAVIVGYAALSGERSTGEASAAGHDGKTSKCAACDTSKGECECGPAKDAARTAEDAARTAEDAAKTAEDAAKTAEDVPKTATVGKPAPGFTLPDAGGQEHSLSDFAGKYVVLEWINFGCPFVRKHYDSGNMQELQQTYTEKDVVWLSICSSAHGKQGDYHGEALTERLEQTDWSGTAYLVDHDGAVGRTYAAKTTPHMFVINPDGILIYAGAIDDKPSSRTSDVDGATNYVALALDAAMAGEDVETTTTKSYGCSVKY